MYNPLLGVLFLLGNISMLIHTKPHNFKRHEANSAVYIHVASQNMEMFSESLPLSGAKYVLSQAEVVGKHVAPPQQL